MDEVKARLEEEERQCQVSLKNLWNECESCLESTCMRYYATCKHGVSTFKRKVGRNFASGECSWVHPKRQHILFSQYLGLKISKVKSVDVVSKITWGEKKNHLLILSFLYLS